VGLWEVILVVVAVVYIPVPVVLAFWEAAQQVLQIVPVQTDKLLVHTEVAGQVVILETVRELDQAVQEPPV
jgi:hypothetical protein